MVKKYTFLLLLSFVFTSCGMQTPIHTALERSSSRTPSEYYSQARQAGFTPGEAVNFSHPASPPIESTLSDTRSERRSMAVIGILAGALVVAGIVVPIVLLK